MLKDWLTIGVLSLFLIGCAENGTDSEKQEATDETETVQEENSSDVTTGTGDVEFTVTEQDASTQTPVTAAPSGALNPAHGEPGHDCAIPVGAPLDGSGAQPQAVNPGATQTIEPNLNVTAPVSGNLNPAHGQPGHDCAVAVGAPLPAK